MFALHSSAWPMDLASDAGISCHTLLTSREPKALITFPALAPPQAWKYFAMGQKRSEGQGHSEVVIVGVGRKKEGLSRESLQGVRVQSRNQTGTIAPFYTERISWEFPLSMPFSLLSQGSRKGQDWRKACNPLPVLPTPFPPPAPGRSSGIQVGSVGKGKSVAGPRKLP